MRKIMFALACTFIGWSLLAYTLIPPKQDSNAWHLLLGANDAYMFPLRVLATHVTEEPVPIFLRFETAEGRIFYTDGFAGGLMSMFTVFFFWKTRTKKDSEPK